MSEWENLSTLEIKQDLILPLEQAEYWASKSNFSQLSQQLPELLEIGRTLALYSGVTLARPGQHLKVENLVEEPSKLLHRLAQALLPLLAKRKGAAVGQLAQWAYQICIAFKLWEAATIYALELTRLGLRQQQLYEAERWSEEALTANKKAKNETLKADITFVKGKIALNREQYSLAYSYFSTVARLFKEQKNLEGLVASLVAIGQIKIYYGEFDSAIPKLNEAIIKSWRPDLEKFLLEGYYYLGLAYFYKEDYEPALNNLTQALKLAQEQNEQILQPDILQKLAEIESNSV